MRPLWSHSANPNQVERKAWTRVFAPLLPSCTKSAGGEQGRCSSGCPGRTRRTGNVGAGLPGLATLWVVGSRDEIGPPLFPAPSRAPAAVPDHTGHAAHLALFPTAGEAQLPSLIRRSTSCASPAVGTRNATCAVWLIARRVSVTDDTCVRRGTCGCARAGDVKSPNAALTL